MPGEATPESLEELTEALRDCGAAKRSVELGGNFSKRAMGGKVARADVILSTRRLNRVIAYEPKDLTISVEAGLTHRDLRETLRAEGQRLPLDPPFSETATIGGVIATNGSGPLRRRYGTARDMIIGMKMATMEGKNVDSGGMVVKNVTGLDMAKLAVGSFGTLAAVASMNFKVFPIPEQERTFVCNSESLDSLLTLRREILRSPLPPSAIDLLNPAALSSMDKELPAGYGLLLQAEGSAATVRRYEQEYQRLARQSEASFFTLDSAKSSALWEAVCGFTSRRLQANPPTCVLRVSATPARLGDVFRIVSDRGEALPTTARAAAAVCYVYCSNAGSAEEELQRFRAASFPVVVEFSPPEAKRTLNLWDKPGNQLEVMLRVKRTFDPDFLLNRGRLFNRI